MTRAFWNFLRPTPVIELRNHANEFIGFAPTTERGDIWRALGTQARTDFLRVVGYILQGTPGSIAFSQY
jgi:hypothetical protein